ncbi:efflux RND transporter permease subunit [Megasphaera vaginalis (ex Bordigoni et al. 2020)]|uniref:efflux RND transporter permease subunit n=1 Tax=Megasphaera vaginalis (ex Bordigoni et al. 2020) TaxID=2045301 RepID=UPI000C79E278|nr:multidrug efflux RND transporter permease subunit [Megasphaera vaginalis (ex Bordigoni et al. 2020)]
MLSKLFINRPIFAIVISLMISVIGLLAMFTLPIAKYPKVTPPQVRISASYVGANAEVVGTTVASVIERQMTGVDNLVSMESSSNDSGVYSMTAQFETGSNDDMDTVNTQNRVSQISSTLPSEVTATGVTVQKSSSSMAMVFSLISPNGTYDQTFMKNYATQYFMDEMKSVSGIGSVQEFGADYAMRIWMDPLKMRVLKVTPTDVISAIKSQNTQAAVGTIGARPYVSDQNFQYTLRADGRLESADEFKKVIIRTNSDGSMVRVGDVADVELGSKSYDVFGSYKGNPSATFMVSLTSDANAMQSVSGVRAVLEKAKKSFPTDMDYLVVYDSTQFVRASIEEVIQTFVEALLLVALIVYLFLQSGRSTLIPLIAVPVSLLGTFAAFKALEFSINTLTLFAMVLSIGLLVDDAIVVIEAVEYEIKYNKKTPKEATLIAMENVQNPVIGVACVLSAVFIPVSFLSGMSGVLYKQFALTIAVSVMISAFIALTLTPALCATVLRVHKPTENAKGLFRFFQIFNEKFDSLVNWYGIRLAHLQLHLKGCIAFLVVISVITAGLFTVIPTSFVPSEDNGFAMVNTTLPEGTTQAETEKTMNQIGAWLQQQPGVKDVMQVVGFSLLAGSTKTNGGVTFITLDDWSQRSGAALSVDTLVGKIMGFGNRLPQATVVAMNPPPIDGMGTSSGFTIQIENRGGHSTNELMDVTKKFIGAARKRPEIGSVYTAFTNDTPGYQLDIDRDKAAHEKVSLSDLYTILQTYYGSYQINDFTIFGRNFKVMVQAKPEYRQNLNDNRYLYVRNSDNQLISVDNFVQPKLIGSASIITRFNDYPSIKVQGSPATGYSSGDALTALAEVAKDTLGEGYAYEWSGMSREEIEAGNKTIYVFVLALLFVFLVLAALYESWKVPFAVLFSVPTGLFGATLFTYLLNQQNNIYFQIGMLAVIGLAAKNAILIVEYAKVRVDERGMDVVSAAIEAAKIRLRPIIMTSLAFVVGCVPLALATGAGAASRTTMGVTVVFGTSMATVLGLFLIPMLFIIVEQVGRRSKRKETATGRFRE